MKSFVIALSIMLFFIIGGNAMSSFQNNFIKEKRESYQACIRLRTNAPNLKLKCENLLEHFHSNHSREHIRSVAKNGIKFLQKDATGTRKVNKNEENKLRNFIKKIMSEKQLRRD